MLAPNPFLWFSMCWTWFFPCLQPTLCCCNSKQVARRRGKNYVLVCIRAHYIRYYFSQNMLVFSLILLTLLSSVLSFMTFLSFFSFVDFVLFRLIFIGDGFFLRLSRLSSFIDCLFAVIFTIAQRLCDGFKRRGKKKRKNEVTKTGHHQKYALYDFTLAWYNIEWQEKKTVKRILAHTNINIIHSVL